MFSGLRNSWGMFPFRIQNTIVSDNPFINKIGIGGVYSLQNAYRERRESTINADISVTLQKYNFLTVQETVEAYLDTKCEASVDPLNYLHSVTPVQKNIENRKPNVVVIQMESLSNHLLDFHSSDFNLLGELDRQLSDAYVFRNFVSATPHTINSLEALLIASPETPVSQSIYRNRKLSTSAALTYKKAGYETSFMSGVELAWRNLDDYLSNSYFDEVIGNAAIKKRNPIAEDGEWGTYDEFLFDEVFKKLNSADKPQFIFVMTTTNHTPYDLPGNYKPFSLKMPSEVKKSLRVNEDVAMRNFRSFQYANDCFGKFIKQIRASGLKETTIVVAVGDHSIPSLFNVPENMLLKKISTPFILFVPPFYKPVYEVDQTRFGSHKDVLSTVFNISLSNTEYVKSGNNLLSPPNDSSYFFGVFNYDIGLSKAGCVRNNDKLFYSWSDSTYTLLVPSAVTSPLEFLNLKTRAYSAAMSCYIKNEFLKKN
jgi:phosphoglycerol transferase MdoB-like AlkP superfamily enzyme